MSISQRVLMILLIICLAAGLATGWRMYYRLTYLWFFMIVSSWLWSYYSIRGIRFVRSARTLRAQVGQVFEERFEVNNLSRIPRLWMEIQDQSNLPGSQGSRVIAMLEGMQSRSYLARTRLVQRGAFRLGPTEINSGDLFGVFRKSLKITELETLVVYPSMVEVSSFPNPPGLLPGGEALRRRTHQVTPNAAGVREYVHGDPLNRIHWLSTARRNRMMVKEFELDPLADVWIFLDAYSQVQSELPYAVPEERYLDFWQHNVPILLPPTTEEYSVSIAASLGRYYLSRGRAVGLVASGSYQILLPPDRGGRQLGKILEALAVVQARGDILLRGLVDAQVKHIARGSTIVLITPSVRREIAVLADNLVRRGQRPALVLLNAESFGGPTGSDRLAFQVRALGVPVRVVSCGVSLEEALSDDLMSKFVPVIEPAVML